MSVRGLRYRSAVNAAFMSTVCNCYYVIMSKRILVTGGRDYADRAMVELMLELAAAKLGPHRAADVVLVHGDCKRYRPDGSFDPDRSADQLAAQTATAFGWQVEPHGVTDAGYRRHGKQIFYGRNQEMVDAGVDICVVFPGGGGTADCSERARKAGVRRIIVEAMSPAPDRC